MKKEIRIVGVGDNCIDYYEQTNDGGNKDCGVLPHWTVALLNSENC